MSDNNKTSKIYIDLANCSSSIFKNNEYTNVAQTYCTKQGVGAVPECILPYLYRNLEFIKCNTSTAAEINKETDNCTAINVYNYFLDAKCHMGPLYHESNINGTLYSCQSKCDTYIHLTSSAISATIPTLSITIIALFFALILSFKRNH